MVVEVALLDETLLQTVGEVHHHFAALQVGTVEHSIYRSRQWVLVGLVLTAVKEVVDSVTVGHHQSVVAPLIAQDIDEQAVAGTAGLALETLVGTHHLPHVTFLHQSLEGRQIGLPEVTVCGLYIHGVAQGLWSAMHGIVLGTGMRLDVFVIIALHTQYGLHAQYGIHVGIFTAGLLSASPARITEDIHVGTPESQFGITRIVGLAHAHMLHAVVRAVPVGACLVTYLREDVIHQFGIKGSCHTDGLGVDGIVTLTHTVAGLTPPVVRRDAQSLNGDTLVHHESYLFLGCQHAQ